MENIVEINDLQATILHQLRINHKRLTMKFQGLDMRLANIAGKVVKGVLA